MANLRVQAVDKRRKGRRRAVRSSSSIGIRRRANASLRWILRVIPTGVYLSVLIPAAWLLYYSIASPYFAVREIVVTGTRLLDPEQARHATDSLGRNALLLRPDSMEESVRRISVVRDAQVSVSLPGRLEVDVTERSPLLEWRSRGGGFLVDREGIAFTREAAPTPLVTVWDLDAQSMEVGSSVDPNVVATVEILGAVLPAFAGIQPPWFEYSRGSGIAVPIPGGPRILIGDASDLDSKLAALTAIREHLDTTKTRADLIDLRFKSRPVFVLAPPTPTRSAQTR